VFEAAIEAGATVLNVPDTVGYTTPENSQTSLRIYGQTSPASKRRAPVGPLPRRSGLAVANSLAAIKAGVDQVECTVNGIGERAGNAALEELVMNLKTRADYYDVGCGVDTTQIYKSSRPAYRHYGRESTAEQGHRRRKRVRA
jgi:2-isopropylmalate synthase